ncbi:hypothetical protein HMPREF0973_00430 [Prevotella veroralis F0319]|uniref:Uncharacterized protein n=1 Tax=Prevotella veroralis F0319 TaxID=649761 RepID=C9MLF5_9BACT|nr:hypothetical protein HMPREF0973_00430 [Prevotella veroralis F0319]
MIKQAMLILLIHPLHYVAKVRKKTDICLLSQVNISFIILIDNVLHY